MPTSPCARSHGPPAQCPRFERESFGAPRQMLQGLDEPWCEAVRQARSTRRRNMGSATHPICGNAVVAPSKTHETKPLVAMTDEPVSP